MYLRILSAVAGLLLVGSGLAVAQSGFTDTFDGAPAAPQPYTAPVPGLAPWDVTVHSRDSQTWAQLEPMTADHGPACEGPPATHPLPGPYADAVFQCNNHVMTALRAEGYGVIYLTPPVVADWTDTPAVIQWDMSTARTSLRDWVDVWVTPFDEHLQLPLENWLPDLTGTAPDTLHIKMDNGGGGSIFTAGILRAGVGQGIAGNWWTPLESLLVPSAARRDTFQLTVSRTHLRFGMPAYNFYWIDADLPDTGFTSGVVQFGHHSYNPQKDCDPSSPCLPNTWHWDNVSVNPALPFTITRAVQAYVDPTTASSVTFASPSQDGDHLRFAAVGDQVQYSLDQGGTWQAARLQPAESVKPDKAQSYWTALPAGTQRVDLRAQGGWWGSWQARDISLWSQVQVAPNRRTPTPTALPATPTRTATPLPPNAPTQTPPPSSTPAPTATDLPTPTSLPTITPTAVTAPTATVTLGPRCSRTDIIDDGLVMTPLPPASCFQQ